MQIQESRKETVANRLIQTYEAPRLYKGKNVVVYSVVVTSTKAKSAFAKPLVWENYLKEEQRNERVATIKARLIEREQEKEERRRFQKETPNPAKVGEILISTWGYEQTNVDFYQVTKVTGRMITIREIAHKTVPGSTYSHGMACEVVASPGVFLEGKPEIKKLVGVSQYKPSEYSVKLTSYSWATLWNGESAYMSWYA